MEELNQRELLAALISNRADELLNKAFWNEPHKTDAELIDRSMEQLTTAKHWADRVSVLEDDCEDDDTQAAYAMMLRQLELAAVQVMATYLEIKEREYR